MVATNHTISPAHHFTTGTAGDTVVLSSNTACVVITNRGAVNVSFSLDGSAATDLGTGFYFVPAGGTKVIPTAGAPNLYIMAPSSCLVSVESFATMVDAAVAGTSSGGGGGAVTNAGTFAVQDSQVGVEDAAETAGGPLFMAGAVRRDTAASSAGTTGDNATINTDATGRLWTHVGAVDGTVAVSMASAPTTAVTESGTWTVQIGNTPNTSPILVTQSAGAAGSLTTYHLVSAATTNATVVKASAGSLQGWYIYNANAASRKIAFHNTASTPTAGASIFFSIMLPPTSAANVFTPSGISFSTGIAFTTVTLIADSDATAVAASDLLINLFYV